MWTLECYSLIRKIKKWFLLLTMKRAKLNNPGAVITFGTTRFCYSDRNHQENRWIRYILRRENLRDERKNPNYWFQIRQFLSTGSWTEFNYADWNKHMWIPQEEVKKESWTQKILFLIKIIQSQRNFYFFTVPVTFPVISAPLSPFFALAWKIFVVVSCLVLFFFFSKQ
jgi:hypothetical protein